MTTEEQKQEPVVEQSQPEIVTPAADPVETKVETITPEPAKVVTQPEATKVETKQPEVDAAEQERQKFIDQVTAYYKEHGTLKPFLEATSTDFAAMSDEQVMRKALREQYPSLTNERFERLYQKQVTDRFMLSEAFDEEDIELGKELLKQEADKLRSKLIDDQKKFLEPTAQAVEQKKNLEAAMLQQKQLEEQFKGFINESELVKSALESKRVAVKFGDTAVNVDVDPQTLVDVTLDNDKFFQLFSDGKGGIDMEFWGELCAFALNREGFKKALTSTLGSTGAAKVIKNDLKNSSITVKGKTATGAPEDFKQKILKALEERSSK